MELKIRNNAQPVVDLGERRDSRVLYPYAASPQRFGVYDGTIHPLDFDGEPSGTVPLTPEANRNVVSASLGLAKDRRILAAMVVAGGKNRYRLAAGTGADPVSVVSRSATEYSSIGRPVWLRTVDNRPSRGLVVADGQLYRFDEAARMYPVPLNLPSAAVTAVAAALDGQRVALIAGGRLYVAAVNLDGGGASIGPPESWSPR